MPDTIWWLLNNDERESLGILFGTRAEALVGSLGVYRRMARRVLISRVSQEIGRAKSWEEIGEVLSGAFGVSLESIHEICGPRFSERGVPTMEAMADLLALFLGGRPATIRKELMAIQHGIPG